MTSTLAHHDFGTSASRNENRLEDTDRTAARCAVVEALGNWRREWARYDGRTLPRADEQTALLRIAAHAIGCSLYDLRTSELDELAAIVAEEAGR